MKFVRFLLSVCIGSALFYFSADWFFMQNWRFNILSVKHWDFAWKKWESGWVIKDAKDVVFFISILSLIPGLIASWFIAHKFPLMKILRFPHALLEKRRLKKLQKLSLEAATGPKNLQEMIEAKKSPGKKPSIIEKNSEKKPSEKKTPEKKTPEKQSIEPSEGTLTPQDVEELASPKPEKRSKASSEERASMIDGLRGKGSAKAPKKQEVQAQPAQTQGALQTGAIPQPQPITAQPQAPVQNKEQEALDRFNLWEKLSNDLESQGLFVLREMKISTFSINIFVITQTGVFLLCEGPIEGMVWEAHEEMTPAVWGTEKGPIPSPLPPMVQAKTLFQTYLQEHMQRYKDIEVNACMILDHAHVTNTPELLQHLESWDVSVLRMGTCQTKDLPDTAALIEYIKSQNISTQAMNDAMAIVLIDLMETNNA